MVRRRSSNLWAGITILLVVLLASVAAWSIDYVDFWNIDIVDKESSGAVVGRYTSIAILPSGQPAISYLVGSANPDLKYAYYDGDNWVTTTVDSQDKVGFGSSLAILPSGYPCISYKDDSNDDLKYASYDGNSWQITKVCDSRSYAHTSLAVLPSGHPCVSFSHGESLVYAWYDGNTWQRQNVDFEGQVGWYNSLAILPSGQPAISYHHRYPDLDLKYAWYDGETWHKITVDSPGSTGFFTSLAVLPSGHPAISYSEHVFRECWYLKYACYDGNDWQITTVDSSGGYTSLEILPSGRPAISYGGLQPFSYGDNDLKYAWYDGNDWHITTVDNTSDEIGSYNSLAVLPSGQPAISYYDNTNEYLKFAVLAETPLLPVPIAVNYTATAVTDLGGTTVVIDGPASNEGSDATGAASSSSVAFEVTASHHVRGMILLTGSDGWEEDDMGFPEYTSCGDANGGVTGELTLSTSESYPAGSELDLMLQVLVSGREADYEDYHLEFWRNQTLIGRVDPNRPGIAHTSVFAGETITFRLFALEEDWSGNRYDYFNRQFEFRIVLRGPTNFDGKGTVDFPDYTHLALRWLATGCTDPDWCGRADFDKSGDVAFPDLLRFSGHWLEEADP